MNRREKDYGDEEGEYRRFHEKSFGLSKNTNQDV
jgi:hypothetical protein